MTFRFLIRWHRAYRSFIERSFLAGLTPNEQVAVWDWHAAMTYLERKRPKKFQNAGEQLGVAFADAFQQQLDELRERLSALHPAALDPGIVRPIETLRKLEKTLAETNRPRAILVSVCSQCGELWKDHGSRCGEPGTFGFSRWT